MKKLVLAVVTALLVSSLFVSCAKKGTCEVCGKEASLKTVKIQGEKADLCPTCAKNAELGAKMLGL